LNLIFDCEPLRVALIPGAYRLHQRS
jgi:hypothetical protein